MTVSPTVEERLAAVLHDAIDGPYCVGEPAPDWTGDPDLAPLMPHDMSEIAASVLVAAKEHGLVVTTSEETGELDAAWKGAEAALPGGADISVDSSSGGRHGSGRR